MLCSGDTLKEIVRQLSSKKQRVAMKTADLLWSLVS